MPSTNNRWKLKNLLISSCASRQPRSATTPQMINDSFAVAVVKESDDPYRDFRQSMLEMISEKEIYSRSDLQQLLRCFLDLNPPRHHEIIVRAFIDIWNAAEDRTPPPSFK
ncbi:transcription repressor OFP6-like [Salvia miltiorrhiza]|uniref:transcription repressor OFP6-like n=1 Tax=Salvia miltiorrhiza TaxID=226208 RepID=UPI0025ABF712|nr:transcription repressor OFP6-like [Salvia miltiorrhiza]